MDKECADAGRIGKRPNIVVLQPLIRIGFILNFNNHIYATVTLYSVPCYNFTTHSFHSQHSLFQLIITILKLRTFPTFNMKTRAGTKLVATKTATLKRKQKADSEDEEREDEEMARSKSGACWATIRGHELTGVAAVRQKKTPGNDSRTKRKAAKDSQPQQKKGVNVRS